MNKNMEITRHRIYRTDQQTRDNVAEVKLQTTDLIYPMFITSGMGVKHPIPNFTNVFHVSIDVLIDELKIIVSKGIDKVLLFGVPDFDEKDADGTSAWKQNNLIEKAIWEVRKSFPTLTIITDVCLCAYTSHGHCGVINNDVVDNDATLPLLAKMALSHASAGATIVAPSAMMDGQVAAIRELLDKNGYRHVGILAYSAKYSSSFYGPFREAAASSPSFGDRKTYQMDYRTITQGISEVEADIEQGAEWVMVKPAHTYLDMICRVKSQFPERKLAAYLVSGEYMMVKQLAQIGMANELNAMLEVHYAIKRAGADFIITYYASELAAYLKG